jgi:CelD/BcsL family acetyltransferase involved in cellulose biosynthesis
MQRKTESLANPFLCPEFAIAVDSFCPNARVAVLADGPDIVGFFPFQRRRFGVGVPIGHGISDGQGLIHAPGVEWDPRELFRACRVSVWQFDHLVEGQRPFERYTAALAPVPVVDLTGGFAAYQENLRAKSPKFCKDLARQARKLEREAGELRFIVGSRDLAELRALMRWKSDQYRRMGLIDRFDRPWIVDVVDYLFSTHSDQFEGLLSVLYAGETPVAAHFGPRSSHVLALWFPAYDTRFSRESPGLVHHLRLAEETAALGIHLINLGKGAEHYKERLKNHDQFVAEGMAASAPLAAAAHRARINAVRWGGPRIRRHPYLYRAADRLLRHYGRTA